MQSWKNEFFKDEREEVGERERLERGLKGGPFQLRSCNQDLKMETRIEKIRENLFLWGNNEREGGFPA